MVYGGVWSITTSRPKFFYCTTTNITNTVLMSSGIMQALLNKHKYVNCVSLKTSMLERNGVPPTREDPFNSNSRTCERWIRFELHHSHGLKFPKYSPGIERMLRTSWKRHGNWPRWPTHHWIGLQVSKSSAGSLKYSFSLLVEYFSFQWYRAVNDF